MNSVAVLLTCHNRREKTLEALRGFKGCRRPAGTEFTIFLVDDGSTDGTGDAVEREFPDTRVIRGDGTLFWNRGMLLAWQTAAAAADFDGYLWLNDDTLPDSGVLEALLKTSTEACDRAVVVGSAHASTGQNWTYGGRPLGVGGVIAPGERAIGCELFNGNLVLVPRAVFAAVGMLDPVFPHTLGDFDYARRAAEAGFELLIAPGAVGVCDRHERPERCFDPEVALGQRVRSFYSPLGMPPLPAFIYVRRHFGWWRAFRLLAAIHLRLLLPGLWRKHER